jgi:predicted ribosomally synthesized peptide with SipW-like signal peptide
MKKKLLIGLSVVAASAALLGGTYAYLTDVEKDANVFTIGNVDIDLLSAVGDETIKLMPNNNDKTKVDYQIQNIGDEAAYVWLRVKVPAALEESSTLAADNIIHWNYLGAYTNGYENTQNIVNYYGEDATDVAAVYCYNTLCLFRSRKFCCHYHKRFHHRRLHFQNNIYQKLLCHYSTNLQFFRYFSSNMYQIHFFFRFHLHFHNNTHYHIEFFFP